MATLLSIPEVTKARSGKVIVVAEFAKEIGFTDVDGSVPASIRNLQFILPGIVFPQIEKKNGQGSIPVGLRTMYLTSCCHGLYSLVDHHQ